MSSDSTRPDSTEPTTVDADVRETADRISDDYERRVQQSMDSYEKRASDVLDKGRAEMRSVLGTENWLALRRLMRREGLTWRERMQPPDGPSRDLAVEMRARKEAVVRFLNGVGASPDGLRAIVKRNFGDVRDQRSAAAGRPGIAYPLPAYAGKLSDLLNGPMRPDPHRWFTCGPPFESGQMGSHVARSPKAYRVAVNPERDLDLATGRISHRMWLSIINASDLDMAHGTLDSQVECVFTAHAAGRVEVTIEATCTSCLHELTVADEWGVSDSSTDQRNFLMMHVLHPNVTGPSLAEMSHFAWNTDYSTNQSREFLTKGWDYFANLTTDGAVAAGDTMIIRAGTRTDDATMTNDMEISSSSKFEWTIKKVHMRVAP
jgi:hypothetical protein